MTRIAVLISGSGTNLQALIDAVGTERIDGEIVLVLSNRASAFGIQRARAAGITTKVFPFSPFKEAANPRGAYDMALAELLLGHGPDLVVLAGWMRILSTPFIDAFADRLINLHPALPGQFPGTNAIERAYQAFQAGIIHKTGVMVHRVVEEVDAGSVLGVKEVSMVAHETLEDLETRIHAAEHALLTQVVTDLCTSPK